MSKISIHCPYHSETLWALIQEHAKGKTSMMYLFAPSQRQLWETVIESEFYGTGHTRKTLSALGWVARKVRVDEVAV